MYCIRVYHRVGNCMNSALVRAFALVSLFALAGLPMAAQIHGAPPSVTSMGFGGHAISGITPSVTSLGPRGYTPGFNLALPNTTPRFGVPHTGGLHPHHGPHNGWNNRNWSGVYAVPYYYPYYGDYYGDYGQDNASAASDQQYAPGPTIFERRGTGLAPLPVEEDRAADQFSQAAPETNDAGHAEPSSPQPDTVLVFKDGHQLEVQNYAIVGNTLYDLTDGHRRKVPLADLDLTATTNQNDDRGVDFQVPSTDARAN